MDRLHSFKVGNREIHVLGTIHGLVSEKEKVRKAFQLMPDKVALGIPPEDLDSLKNFDGDVPKEDFFRHLENYGEVEIPPPDLIEATKICEEEGIPIEAIDMDDEEYARAITKKVSIWAILRSSRKMKKLRKRKFDMKMPEEFVKEWDEEINSVKSFGRVEEMREEKIASKLMKMDGKILAIVPYQRMEGIVNKLKLKLKSKNHKNGGVYRK